MRGQLQNDRDTDSYGAKGKSERIVREYSGGIFPFFFFPYRRPYVRTTRYRRENAGIGRLRARRAKTTYRIRTSRISRWNTRRAITSVWGTNDRGVRARRGHAATSMVDGINFRAVERECRASVVVTNFVSLRNKHARAAAAASSTTGPENARARPILAQRGEIFDRRSVVTQAYSRHRHTPTVRALVPPRFLPTTIKENKS